MCAQNGVENERRALRRFADVIGMCVMLPATHVAPGAVDADSLPVVGVLDVGRYPHGVDDTVRGVAADLSESGFRSDADADVMRWKYEKLLTNLSTALRALCGLESDDDAAAAATPRAPHRRDARGRARLLRGGGDRAADRRGARPALGRRHHLAPDPRSPARAGSAWQSLARATGAIEVDGINGEIVLLGRLHGIATPVNVAVQTLANDAARRRLPPGSCTPDEVARAAGVGEWAQTQGIGVKQLEGRVAVVTGAASGIGFGLAGALAAEGATVMMADVDETRLQAKEEQLRAPATPSRRGSSTSATRPKSTRSPTRRSSTSAACTSSATTRGSCGGVSLGAVAPGLGGRDPRQPPRRRARHPRLRAAHDRVG